MGMMNQRCGLHLLLGSFLLTLGCSTSPPPLAASDEVRQHADKAFQLMKAQEPSPPQDDRQPLSHTSTSGGSTAMPKESVQKAAEIPLAEIGPSDGDSIRATGYGNLAKGLYLCQHSADLAARVELSKLVRVKVTERSTDRIRERTGKDAEQDIEVVREGMVDEVLSGVRIIDRKVDKEAGICSSTALIPKRNLFPASAGPNAGPAGSR